MSDKLLFLSANQAQAVDTLCLLLDGMDHEAQGITHGIVAAEAFKERLRLYMGAFHFVVDGLEANGKALEELAEAVQS